MTGLDIVMTEAVIYLLLVLNVVLGVRIVLISSNPYSVSRKKHLVYSITGIAFITVGVVTGANINSLFGMDLTTLKLSILALVTVGFASIYVTMRS